MKKLTNILKEIQVRRDLKLNWNEIQYCCFEYLGGLTGTNLLPSRTIAYGYNLGRYIATYSSEINGLIYLWPKNNINIIKFIDIEDFPIPIMSFKDVKRRVDQGKYKILG